MLFFAPPDAPETPGPVTEIQVTPEMIATGMRYIERRYGWSERLISDMTEDDLADLLRATLAVGNRRS